MEINEKKNVETVKQFSDQERILLENITDKRNTAKKLLDKIHNFTKGSSTFPSSFKFHKMWLGHNDCKRLVQEVWSNPVFGCPMYVLSPKLENVKAALKDWNINVFGNIDLRVKNAIDAVDRIQQDINIQGASESLIQQEALAQVELHQALSFEEEFWREKARINWHCSGDRNTSYFHRLTKINQASKSMTMLRKDDTLLIDQTDIEHHVLDY